MKKMTLAFIFFTLLSMAAMAQEEPRYNFASMQVGKEINIPVGGTGLGKIYFYNIDGNRITHIGLFVSEAPEGWEVRLEPEPRNVSFRIDGTLITMTENLHIEPSEALNETPEIVPEGIEYISIPGRGWAPAKVARIFITIPEDEVVGRIENVTIGAVAEWLGQYGAVAVKQTRDFTFEVRAVPVGIEEVVPEERPSPLEALAAFIATNLMWIAAGIAVAIILAALLRALLV